MGKDQKKQLTRLLAFVKDLYDNPDYKDFAAGIQAIVLGDKDFAERLREGALQGDPETLQKIETYLSLDYQIDARSLPDFSFITDDAIRERIQADYREMLRYEFGTRSHKIDFAEFCRYATLQFEMLINYYYEHKYLSDVNKLAAAIVADNPSYKPGDYLRVISDIPLKTKVYRLRHEFGLDTSDLNPILYCLEVRNRQSHRSLLADKDHIREYEQRLKAGKVWNHKTGVPMYKRAVDEGIVTREELNEYSFQVWFDSQPFEGVMQSLVSLAGLVAAAL